MIEYVKEFRLGIIDCSGYMGGGVSIMLIVATLGSSSRSMLGLLLSLGMAITASNCSVGS